jgi:hypothetical protein
MVNPQKHFFISEPMELTVKEQFPKTASFPNADTKKNSFSLMELSKMA